MKKIGWALYGISLSLMFIKLFVISFHEYETFTTIYSTLDFEFWQLYDSMMIFGLIITPVLVLFSLFGYFLRRNIGFFLTLCYAYYLLAYHLVSLISYESYYNSANPALMIFGLLILLFNNIRPSASVISPKLTLNSQIILNVVSLASGFIISEGHRKLIEVYTNVGT